MAKKVVCDVCEKVIQDGNNVGLRKPIFSHTFGGSKIVPNQFNGKPTSPDQIIAPGILVEVTTVARVNGNSEADLCVDCLKEAVAKS